MTASKDGKTVVESGSSYYTVESIVKEKTIKSWAELEAAKERIPDAGPTLAY